MIKWDPIWHMIGLFSMLGLAGDSLPGYNIYFAIDMGLFIFYMIMRGNMM